MVNLSQYRLATWGDVKKYVECGGEDFKRYYSALKSILDNLGYDQQFDIIANIGPEYHEKFIKTACVYMAYQVRPEVEFTDDYLFIRRRFVEKGIFIPKRYKSNRAQIKTK